MRPLIASFGLVLSLPVCFFARSAAAFDDSNCSRVETVEVRDVQEPFKSAEEYANARARAQEKAYEQAAAQAIGIWVESRREEETKVDETSAKESFSEIDKSELAGFIRPTNVKETITKIGNQDAVSLTLNAQVCIPKPEFLAKWKQEKAERERKPPKAVDPNSIEWFDAKSGQPLLWYRRDKNQQYFFYDNKGFDPATGEMLQPVTSKVREEWASGEQARQQAAAQRASEEKRQNEAAEARQQLLASAGENCDRLAGNPYDKGRGDASGGATFEFLKQNVDAAIASCEAAIQKFPNELKYTYELARAYQVSTPLKAAPLLKGLMARRYPAAFDNFGWILIDARAGHTDVEAAANIFRRGVALGDPSSMYSLASLIIDGKTSSGNLEEALRLLQSAAQLGHLDAEARIADVQQSLNDAQQIRAQRALEEQQARQMFFGVMGGILQSIPRK